MKKTSDFTRINPQPEFPKWDKPKVGIGSFILGIFVWIGLLIVFLFLAYTQLFSANTAYLLNLIKPKSYQIPFWFSALIVLFFFPISLLILLLGGLIRLLKS